jgi:hypothetical protein
MAWTKEKLFSYLQGCNVFTLFAESGPWEDGRGQRLLVLAQHHSGQKFPARIIRNAFQHSQDRANEVAGNVRLRIHDGENEIGVKNFKPHPATTKLEMLCSRCSSPATKEVVVATTTEKTCDIHYDKVLASYDIFR